MTSKKVQVVYADKPGLYEVDVDQVLRKREGSMIVIDDEILAPGNMVYIIPGFKEYNATTDEVTNLWKGYIGKDYPKLYPRYEILEDAQDYMIVRRYDGQLFKVTDNFAGEILGNIYINSGKSLWDIVVVECMIEAKRNPDKFEDEDYRAWYAEWVVYAISFLAYVADLIELRF